MANRQPTSYSYYNPLLTLEKSVPYTQMGYKNPVVPMYRRGSTPGWLDGSKVAMPEYPYNGRNIVNTEPVWYGGSAPRVLHGW